ncbi:hypothetical protein L9F63_016513 [Diploptera punctata]|uniref:DNA/RNA non-specific endonuclease domain-containing protein n=1 Tax=Diploptera punctata TaxID=6984 RepID=A0AAD8A0X3_DIPPU|nr:hypothetical protein L9F63_016513 [Diploptera punctata]
MFQGCKRSTVITVMKIVAFVLVIALISLIIFITVGDGKSIRAGCNYKINGDLTEPQPLFLIPGGSKDGFGFYLPEDSSSNVHINAGASIYLACPGSTNYLEFAGSGTRTALAKCESGSTYTINSKRYDFSEFSCKSYPFHTARKSGDTCYDGTKSHIEIGFEVENDFYKIMDVCFDDSEFNTLYSKFTVVSGIGGYQSGFPRPSFIQGNFYPGLSVDNLYTKNTQRQTISKLLGSTNLGNDYVSNSSDYYLARGHMTAKADYVYGTAHRATFHFVNIAPQWQTFNGGNWNSLEMSVRTYADKNKLDLEVYTGTHGVTTLPNSNGVETEIYLYVDDNNNKGLPVPKVYWKVVYNSKTREGIAFIGINNPYVTNPSADYIFCTDVCSRVSWLQWDQKDIKKGYSYCCDVNDFRKTVKTLPQFTVNSLLT